MKRYNDPNDLRNLLEDKNSVWLRDSRRYLCHECWLEDFGDDLTHPTNHDYDIMKVMSPDGEVLYDRENPVNTLVVDLL